MRFSVPENEEVISESDTKVSYSVLTLTLTPFPPEPEAELSEKMCQWSVRLQIDVMIRLRPRLNLLSLQDLCEGYSTVVHLKRLTAWTSLTSRQKLLFQHGWIFEIKAAGKIQMILIFSRPESGFIINLAIVTVASHWLPRWITVSELHWWWLLTVLLHQFNSESIQSTQISCSGTENSEFAF